MSASKSAILRNSVSLLLVGKLFSSYHTHLSKLILLCSPTVTVFKKMIKGLFSLAVKLLQDLQGLVLSDSANDRTKRYLALTSLNLMLIALLLWILFRNIKLADPRHFKHHKHAKSLNIELKHYYSDLVRPCLQMKVRSTNFKNKLKCVADYLKYINDNGSIDNQSQDSNKLQQAQQMSSMTSMNSHCLRETNSVQLPRLVGSSHAFLSEVPQDMHAIMESENEQVNE